MRFFLIFIIYSFIGWTIEVVRILTISKKLVNRGFLIGPYCPIYGFGCLLIILLLNSFINNPIILFLISMVVCGLLEYVTSYMMEKMFKARWWDYSNRKFNINGRICINTLILFGMGSLLLIYILNPVILNIVDNIPLIIQNIVGILLLTLFTVDIIASYCIINNIKNLSINAVGDSTEKISKYVKGKLKKKSILYRRIEEAFPNFILNKEKIELYFKKRAIKIEIEITKQKRKNAKKRKEKREKRECKGI